MSRETRPVPGLFGGVSQQIPAMRNPTQCSLQRNFMSTVVDGLYTRPGTRHLGSLALSGANGGSTAGTDGDAFGHYIPRPDGSLYLAVIRNGNLMVFNADTGAAQTVTYPDGKSYLVTDAAAADSFAGLTLADYTFVVNKRAFPRMTLAVAPVNNERVTYIDVRTAVPNVTYSITVGAVTESYTSTSTPTQGAIADALAGQLVTSLGATYLVQRLTGTNVIKLTKAALPLESIRVYDSWDTNTMRNISQGVPAYAELPYRFETGYTISVDGTPENNRDTYYVTWNGAEWVETTAPGTTTTLNHATMPHRLFQDPLDGSWVFEQVDEWGDRLAGDADSAPLPSFVGQNIRDLFFFRNRLGFLASDAVVLSRAGEYFDFFPRTATQVLDNDPIDLASPVDGVTYFAWAVPFNQNLLIWSDAAQQLVLAGGEVLSPKTARLIPASTFAADPSAKPGALGNRAVFAEKAGEFASLSSYRVAQDTVTNTAVPLTDHVPRYVPAGPRQLAASTSAKLLAAVPRGASRSLKLFKYELDIQDGESYTQRSWCDLEHGSLATSVRTVAAYWRGLELYLLMHYTSPGDGAAGGRFCSEVINFQRFATDTGLDHSLCLDRRVLLSGGAFDGTNTTYTVPYTDPGLAVFRCAFGREPYPLTSAVFAPGSWQTTVSIPGDTRGVDIWAGVRYSGTYEFTEALLRDTNGVPIQAASMKLLHYLLHFKDSSRARAVVTPYLRDPYTYEFGGRVLGLPLHGAERKSLSSGNFRVPVDAAAEGTTVAIETTSLLEVVIPYAEWVAEVNMKARR